MLRHCGNQFLNCFEFRSDKEKGQLLVLAQQFIDALSTVAPDFLAAPIQPGGEAPPGAEQILKVLGWAKWLVTAAAVAGAMFIGARMAISHRRGDDTNTSALGWWLGGCILLGVAPQLVDVLV